MRAARFRESVAILGGGPIGLLFLLLFRGAGARAVYVVEPGAARRKVAELCGADAALDPHEVDLDYAIGPGSGEGVDLVVDAVGRCLADAISLVRPGGRVLLFGMDQKAAPVTRQYGITRHEITVIGSFIQRTAFPKVVRLLESGSVPVEKLITHSLPLTEFGRARNCLEKAKQSKPFCNRRRASGAGTRAGPSPPTRRERRCGRSLPDGAPVRPNRSVRYSEKSYPLANMLAATIPLYDETWTLKRGNRNQTDLDPRNHTAR